jgi:hypothetical protein
MQRWWRLVTAGSVVGGRFGYVPTPSWVRGDTATPRWEDLMDSADTGYQLGSDAAELERLDL